MIIHSKKDINTETVIADNEIILLYNNLPIVQNEWGDLYYCTIPADLISVGDVVPTSVLQPLSKLSDEQQKEILILTGGETNE